MKAHYLKAIIAGSLFVALAWSAIAQPSVKPPDSLEALQQRFDELLNQPRYAAALWGVKIESLDTGKTIFERNAEKLFEPASNSKIYTMSMVLERLGPSYRIKTSLYGQNHPDENGVLKGDLVVYGRGDPTISGEYNHAHVLAALEPLVAALTNAGVKEISGDLVGDDSYFHGPPFGAGWDWGDLEDYYGAEISALTINSNVIQMLVKPGENVGAPANLAFDPPTTYIKIINRTKTGPNGSRRSLDLYRPVAENVVYVTGQIPLDDKGSSEDVTMHNPAGLFVALFRDVLEQHGIKVGGRTRTMNWMDREAEPLDLKQWIELGSIESRPVSDILHSVEKPSQNLYTDMMLEHVGASAGNESENNSESSGIRQLNHFLAQAGVKRGQTIFDEGSGLSRNNLTSPDATVTLLAYMSHTKNFNFFYNALPIAGVDGTLRHRFKGTLLQGNLRAKTGTLRWANSLSGYMTNAVGEHFVFSMMLNRFQNPDPDRSKTHDMDVIAELLANFNVRSEPGK
jgi:D-alanyl-D-alanine carboxypeptidase/D-alanyl-D-alanine-endopeptidase (penicillin-binding protein 4)